MKKAFISISVLLAISVLLSSCGYNRIMYNHLSDPNNYEQYDVTVATVYNSDIVNKDSVVGSDSQSDGYVNDEGGFLGVVFETKKELSYFYGVSEESFEKDCSEYTVILEICSENDKILYENGFYDILTVGSEISVKASNWIYQDTDFFYVISVTCNGVEYLNESDGLNNIIEIMEENKTLF